MSPYYYRELSNIELFNEILVALTQITEKINGDDITEVKLGRHDINYYTKDTITLAVVTLGKRITKQELTSIIKKIFNAFSNKYREHLKQEIFNPYSFQSFSTIIDNILHTDSKVNPFLILFFTPIIEKE